MNKDSKCPYCLNIIDNTDDTITCDSCKTTHHTECWKENGGCCVRNCLKVVKHIEIEIENEKVQRLVLSRESVESAKPRHARANTNPCISCGIQLPDGELYCIECIPKRDENQDVKNTGPLLIMFGILIAVIAWIIITTMVPGSTQNQDTDSPKIGFKTNR